MLKALHIRNVVLIDQLTVQFAEGLCALTGETGAGKSILLDSLGLAMGARADAGLVRRGSDQATVTAEFHLPETHPALTFLETQGLEAAPEIILRRTLSADGRSRAFVNDQPISVGTLKTLGDLLIEIHGQFDTQGLLNPSTHRDFLDAGAGLSAQAQEVEALWRAWAAARTAFATARDEAEAARRDEEYLRACAEELDLLAPETGEEALLSERRERLRHRAQVLEALAQASDLVSGDGGGAIGRLNTAWRVLERVAERAGPGLTPVLDGLDQAMSLLQDAAAELESLTSDLDEGGETLESLDDRLHALRGAARKHRCAPDDLPELRDSFKERLALIRRSDDVLTDLGRAADAAKARWLAAAKALSTARSAAAAQMDARVAQELPPLKLEKARFVTRVVAQEDEGRFGPHGLDDVWFEVATNPGAAPGPLNKIASGGEMSRFLLALKAALADAGSACTMIFDEVDSGVGGAVAEAVGERLSRLSRSGRQVLVVTHSPQVAAKADHHWIVRKSEISPEAIRTTILPLDSAAARREEIARMLSGAQISDEARAAAERLLTGT